MRNAGGAAIIGLGYDVQGNLSIKNGQGYQFDFGNRLRVATSLERYRYDGHGRRSSVIDAGSGKNRHYLYSQGGALAYLWDQGTGERTQYIQLAGSLVAARKVAGSGAVSVRYQHTDALGSPVAETNEQAAVVLRTAFTPYGASIGASQDGVGYTGHVMDGSTGLTYMQQRFMDPTVGVFLSVDPVTADNNPIGAFNRYRYGNDSPYSNIDPDGRKACGMDTTCAIEQGARGGVLMSIGGRAERSQKQAAVVEKAATAAANKALGSVASKAYGTPGAAARAWAGRVRSVADRFDTEIASRLFYSKDGIVLGSTVSNGLRYSVNPDFSLGPSPFSVTAGFVHTHPTMALFSGNDLNYALGQYRAANGWVRNGEFDQSAFVSLPDGRVVGWKVSSYMVSNGRSYLNEDYYDEH